MSYALLWIEALLVSLLFATVFIVLGLRRKTRWAAVPLCVVGLLMPMLPLISFLSLAVALRYVPGMRGHSFWWALALVVLYISGGIAALVAGRRRDAGGIQRAFLWPLGHLTAGWLIVVCLAAMTVWNMDLQARIEIQAMRSEAGAIALSVAPPAIPDSANAALVYRQANEKFVAATTPADKDVDYIGLDPRSPVVEQYLQRQAKTLELLRRAADLPECRVDFDYSRPDMGRLLEQMSHRGAVNLLDIAARVEAATGNVDLAVADARRRFSAAAHASSAPALIGGLSTLANESRACRTAERVLPAVRNAAQLDALGSLDPAWLTHAFAQSLRSEEALGLALYCDMADASGVYAGSMSSAAGHVMWLAYLRDEIIHVYRNILRQAQQVAERPFYETSAARQELGREGKGGVFTAGIESSLQRSFQSLAETQALRSSVITAIAATRYRLEHGEYPASVQQIVPGYMARPPLDPFDGQPLRMNRLSDGSLVIYSVGADLKDDGGAVDSDRGRAGDVGIRLGAMNK